MGRGGLRRDVQREVRGAASPRASGPLGKKRVQVFKSHLDDRYTGVFRISSHDGTEIEAQPVTSSVQIAELVCSDTEVLGIDEAQFLDDGVVRVVSELADSGVRVIVAGTDMDFRGEPFGPIPQLLAVAEVVHKLHAICVKCGDLATRISASSMASRRRPRAPPFKSGGRELRGAMPEMP